MSDTGANEIGWGLALAAFIIAIGLYQMGRCFERGMKSLSKTARRYTDRRWPDPEDDAI